MGVGTGVCARPNGSGACTGAGAVVGSGVRTDGSVGVGAGCVPGITPRPICVDVSSAAGAGGNKLRPLASPLVDAVSGGGGSDALPCAVEVASSADESRPPPHAARAIVPTEAVAAPSNRRRVKDVCLDELLRFFTFGLLSVWALLAQASH